MSAIDVLLVEQWGHGGTAAYINYLGAALAARAPSKARVTLLVAEDFAGRPDDCAVVPLLPGPGSRSEARAINGVRMLQRASRARSTISRQLRQRRPTVLHFSGVELLTGAVLGSARGIGVPVVATLHDLPRRELDLAKLLSLQGRQSFVRADAVIAHGPASATEFTRRFPDFSQRLAVLRYGPFWYGEPSRLAATDGGSNVTALLFFGALRRDKGLSLLLRALSLDRRKRFHLHVVTSRPAASEPPPETYQREAEDLGIAGRVDWHVGYVPDQEVPDIFTACDIVVLPYGASYMGFSAVLAMAIAYGRPVVASSVGDTGQAVEEFSLGRTADVGSAPAMLRALHEVADDPYRFRQHIGAYACENSWERVADDTWDLYRSLLPAQE